MANYKAEIKLHLPNDPPWRSAAKDTSNTDKADNPEELWRKVIISLSQRLGLATDINVFTGILLNLINPFPEDFRLAIVNGVTNGYALNLSKDEEGALVGTITQGFPALAFTNTNTPPEPALTMPDGQQAKRTPSGLIIPI